LKLGVSERIHVDWQPPVKLEFSPLYTYENAGGGNGGSEGGRGGGAVGELPTVGTSRYGEFTAVENCIWTPSVPPVGNAIQPLFARLPASHAAIDEVTSNLCQPAVPGKVTFVAPRTATLAEFHDELANGRLVHVTVDCRKRGGAERGTRQREGVSTRVPHAVAREGRASSRAAGTHGSRER
jgi:hypothetical protein